MSKLSIITICYNEPDLEKTCESIVSQTWQDFEWIVIDGGSNQQTLDIFEKYKNRINVFISEPDNGIYNAMNKGLSLATSEWINILNAGDSYHSKDVLEKVYKFEHNADILYGEQYSVYKDNIKKSCQTKFPKNINEAFFINDNISTPAMFIKQNLFKKFGYFNEKYKIVSDFEKWVIFLKNNITFQHIDIVVVDFDMSGISSNQQNASLHKKERTEVINKYFTSEEIELAKKEYKNFSMWEQIFSITNTRNRKHKVLTILGIHIKIKK